MRKQIGTYDAAEETYSGLEKNGIYLVSGETGNPMTIGWATLGPMWSRPVLDE